MASDFLQGFQVGANMFAQAKQLQEARQRSMMQAQEMLQNIRAAQAMEQYRNEQMKLARAEEARKAQEWQQTQQLEQQRQQFVSNIPQMRKQQADYYNLIPEQMRPQPSEIDEQIGRDYVMKFGTPANVGTYLGQQSREQIALDRETRMRQEFSDRERRMSDEFGKRLEEAKAVREQRKEIVEADRELKLTPSQQSELRMLESDIIEARKTIKQLRDSYADDESITAAEAELAKAKKAHASYLSKIGGTSADKAPPLEDPTKDFEAPAKPSGKFILKSVK